MKNKLFFIISLIFLAFALSACTGASTASSWPALTIDAEKGIGYLAYNKSVYAINLTTGSETWKFPNGDTKGGPFYSAPILTPDGQLIAGSYNDVLYSINPADGKANGWNYKAKHRIIASPLVVDNVIYLPIADGKLIALNLKLQAIWKTPFSAKGPIWSQPTLSSECGCILVASMDHHLYAIDAKDGSVIWDRDLGGALVGKPALSPDGKLLYLGSFNNEMLTIDTATGETVGQPYITEGWIWGGPAYSDGHLYFGDVKGNFYTLNTQDGSVETTKVEGAIISTPLVLSDTVYVTTDAGNLYVMSKDGKQTKPVQNFKGKIQAAPIQYKDMILITPVGNDSFLIALDANGNQVWAYPAAKAK